MQGERAAVTAPPSHLATDTYNPRIPLTEIPFQVTIMFLAVRRRHQRGYVLADGLLVGVAEQPLRSGIERLDASLSVNDDDGVHGGLDDGSPSHLVRAELFLELYSCR